jgi:hypothetical protein
VKDDKDGGDGSNDYNDDKNLKTDIIFQFHVHATVQDDIAPV